jgi:hypothetical protein
VFAKRADFAYQREDRQVRVNAFRQRGRGPSFDRQYRAPTWVAGCASGLAAALDRVAWCW